MQNRRVPTLWRLCVHSEQLHLFPIRTVLLNRESEICCPSEFPQVVKLSQQNCEIVFTIVLMHSFPERALQPTSC